jgi:hypothetical protein
VGILIHDDSHDERRENFVQGRQGIAINKFRLVMNEI